MIALIDFGPTHRPYDHLLLQKLKEIKSMDSIFCNFAHIEKENLLGQQALVREKTPLLDHEKVYVNLMLPTYESIQLNNFADGEIYQL